MKKLYKKFFTPLLSIVLIFYAEGLQAQCAGGHVGGTAAYDTTVAFSVGVTTKQIKFPKFDPQTAMLSCVKLIVTMVGVVNYVGMQNLSTTSINQADFYYNRNDDMSGPGLTPALSNNLNGHYGPYNLTPYDGVSNSGTDFQSISNDTVLKKVMTRTLTDSVTISQFYGTDSLVYDYNMSLFTSASFTADNSSSVSTSALVNFRLEYCTCPIITLPLGTRNFYVTKQGSGTAQLNWEAENGSDNYYYEIEVSRDGKNFTKTSVVNKLINTPNPAYHQSYAIKANEYGRYYFRIKQRWLDGYYRYSEIKSVDFTNPLFAAISIYPNPSSGVIGIKFISVKGGTFSVQVSNAAGQIVLNKNLQVAETDYKTIGTMVAGLYYIKITDTASGASCINQMVVK